MCFVLTYVILVWLNLSINIVTSILWRSVMTVCLSTLFVCLWLITKSLEKIGNRTNYNYMNHSHVKSQMSKHKTYKKYNNRKYRHWRDELSRSMWSVPSLCLEHQWQDNYKETITAWTDSDSLQLNRSHLATEVTTT